MTCNFDVRRLNEPAPVSATEDILTPCMKMGTFEPPYDKTKKMTVLPAKTQISQADLSLRCALNGYLRTQAFFMRTAKTDHYWADSQADLSHRWAHRSFYWFCNGAAHFSSISSESRESPQLLGYCYVP